MDIRFLCWYLQIASQAFIGSTSLLTLGGRGSFDNDFSEMPGGPHSSSLRLSENVSILIPYTSAGACEHDISRNYECILCLVVLLPQCCWPLLLLCAPAFCWASTIRLRPCSRLHAHPYYTPTRIQLLFTLRWFAQRRGVCTVHLLSGW
jgi:hypothetical protein